METKKAYLTIDDGPSNDFIEKVEFLYTKKIPAIFFCLGKQIIERKEGIVEAINKGFIIGNHSFEHKYFSDMTLGECKQSILETDRIIEEMYTRAGKTRPGKYFRFPYFDTGGDLNSEEYSNKLLKPKDVWYIYKNNSKRDEIQSYLKVLGYKQPYFKNINKNVFPNIMMECYDVKCTFDQMEYWLDNEKAPWSLNKEEKILSRIDEDYPEEGRSLNHKETNDIILIHDDERTTKLFYKIINRYIEKKIVFLEIP